MNDFIFERPETWSEEYLISHGFQLPKEEILIATATGYKSLSAATPSDNTYPKNFFSLWARFRSQHRSALVDFCFQLDRLSLSKFQAVVKSLTDGQLEVLIEVLDFAPLPRFRLYLEICATRSETVLKSPQMAMHHTWNTFSDVDSQSSPHIDACVSVETDSATKLPDNEIVESAIAPTSTSLMKQVHNVSYDVLLHLWEQVAANTFAPGYVFPDQTPDHEGCIVFQGHRHYNPNIDAFLALDRILLAEYQRKFWEENTWVIGPGQAKTVSFLDRMEDQSKRIRSIHLSFSTVDVPWATDLLSWIQVSMLAKDKEINNLILLEEFTRQSEECSGELLTAWWRKFNAVTWLELDHLTLDLRNAYGADNVFLPSFDWVLSLIPFRYRYPAKFTILAPTAKQHAEIERGFKVRNRR